MRRFVEKPDAAHATQMTAAGNYLWNAGIFLPRAADLNADCKHYVPQMCDHVGAALDQGVSDFGFLRLALGSWEAIAAVSIDYAAMEKADNPSVAHVSRA